MRIMRYFAVVVICSALSQITLCSSSDILRQRKLPPCRACKNFIEAFQRVCIHICCVKISVDKLG